MNDPLNIEQESGSAHSPVGGSLLVRISRYSLAASAVRSHGARLKVAYMYSTDAQQERCHTMSPLERQSVLLSYPTQQTSPHVQ